MQKGYGTEEQVDQPCNITPPYPTCRARSEFVAAVLVLLLIGLCHPKLNAAELFREGFESGVARWETGCPAKIISDTAQPSNHFLRIGEGGMYVRNLTLPAEFTLTARVRVPSKGRSEEAPILLHRQPDGVAVQVHLIMGANVWAGLLGGKPWWQPAGSEPSPVPLRVGEWVSLRIVCARGCIGVWVNDKPALIVKDPLPKPGGFAIRTGSGGTDYDDLIITTPTAQDCEFNGLREKADAALLSIEQRASATINSKTVEISHGSIVFPLKPLAVSVSGADAPLEVSVLAPDQSKPLLTQRLSGKSGGTVNLNAPLGEYTLVWKLRDKELARTKSRLTIATDFESNDPADNACFSILKRAVQTDAGSGFIGSHKFTVNPNWIRDCVHEMKAFKWWKHDISSYIDCLIDLQTPRGFFYEIAIGTDDPHWTFVPSEFKHNVGHECLIRLEIEADVEYLVVEGAYQIWQATGDNAAMAKRLPALERGLQYCLTDPTRWDAEHGLMKRPFSIDTWDFVWGSDTSIRYIRPEMPMGIMHGDNSGLYQACLQVAKMREALGDREFAEQWRERAEGIRRRANTLLWNGNFYIHQHLLTPVNTGADETKMLSLSNPYDINRGMPTHEMAVRIIDEYRMRRRTNSHDYAEWYSLDPPYPEFVGYKSGSYCNGAIGGFVGGELAKAAFRHGREEYGADILKRMRKITEKCGTLPFFMRRSDGGNCGGGPCGWPAAAVLSAMMEGLAGLTDRGVLFQDVEIAPRYPAAGITDARVSLCYGPSKAYLATKYHHDVKARSIMMQVAGAPRKVLFHILLPSGTIPTAVRVDGKACKSETRLVENSRYCDFSVTRKEVGVMSVCVSYRNE